MKTYLFQRRTFHIEFHLLEISLKHKLSELPTVCTLLQLAATIVSEVLTTGNKMKEKRLKIAKHYFLETQNKKIIQAFNPIVRLRFNIPIFVSKTVFLALQNHFRPFKNNAFLQTFCERERKDHKKENLMFKGNNIFPKHCYHNFRIILFSLFSLFRFVFCLSFISFVLFSFGPFQPIYYDSM